jgi:hypothetical protein
MAQKNKKQFGIWMDTHHASIVGRPFGEPVTFSVIGVETIESTQSSPHKFFKQILDHMPNAEEVHITGTGTAQEQLINYMKESPQFKDTKTKESTSNKMSDEKLVEYISKKFI